MEKITKRTQEIRDRLCKYVLDDLGCAIAIPDIDSWRTIPEAGHGHRFGWLPPGQIAPDMWMVVLCPQVIAETTLHLDEDDLDTYLDMVEVFIDGVIIRPEIGPRRAIARVEDELYENAHDAFTLLTDVQARAIELGLV